MTEASPEIVKRFFLQLHSAVLDGVGLEKATIDLIEEHPDLLLCDCPTYDDKDADIIDDEDIDMTNWTGLKATECMCDEAQAVMPGAREVLLELLKYGAVATDDCYNMLAGSSQGVMNAYFPVVMLSGYMPLKMENGTHFLDKMTNLCDDQNFPGTLEDCIKLLHPKQVKLGENLESCGETFEEYMVLNLQKLPTLEAGVTHKEGGPFDKHLIEWRKKNVASEDGKEEDDKLEEGEASDKKRQKTSE